MTRKANCELDCKDYHSCRLQTLISRWFRSYTPNEYDPYDFMCTAGPCVSNEEYHEYIKEREKRLNSKEGKEFIKKYFPYLFNEKENNNE